MQSGVLVACSLPSLIGTALKGASLVVADRRIGNYDQVTMVNALKRSCSVSSVITSPFSVPCSMVPMRPVG
jgi:hypothetical protein